MRVIKILLLGFSNLRYMPYARFWMDRLDPKNQDLHLLLWNRDGSPEDCPEGVRVHEFRWPMEDQIPKYRKLPAFWNYRRYALSLLDRERFDYIAVLHSLPGVLLLDRLLRDYRGRFFFDYRDVTYESFPPYRGIIHKLVDASRLTFISSDGFRRVLPRSEKLHTVHNLRPVSESYRPGREPGPIRIGFWGCIRHEKLNRRLIAALGSDPRFQLHYYGPKQAAARNLEDYVNRIGADNVFFHGPYRPGDQDRFALETDVLHNLYSNTESPSQKLAVTNKFYDGLLYGLPQLCFRGSWMGDLAEREALGLACDPQDPDFADQVWDYYRSLDREALIRRCRSCLELARQENDRGGQILHDAVQNNS